MNLFTPMLLALAGFLSLPFQAPVPPTTHDCTTVANGLQDEQMFSWTGSCRVECANGQCKTVCKSGIVYARNTASARIKALGEFRVEAGQQGQIVEGSIQLRIEF